MIPCRIFDKILLISMQTLLTKFLLCCSRRHWCFLAASSMIFWWSFEETFWNIDNFDGNFFDFYCFCCVNLWITDVSLLLRRWFVDDSLKIHIWNFDNLDEVFSWFYCFCFVNLWIIHVSLLLQWWFVDDSLKKHCWHYANLDANGRDHWSL